MREIYLLWNDAENRPMINRGSFGSIITYLTVEQAQARLADDNFLETIGVKISIKKVKVID